MRHTLRVVAATLVLALAATACGGGGGDDDATGDQLVAIGAGLSGPAGLAATVYAQGIPNTAAFAFDAEGRLWVATAAYSDEGTDSVFLMGGAGDTPVPVITGLHTALGLLWYKDSLYVASAAHVEAYSSFDGTTFTQHRSVVTFDSGVGEVNGITLAPNGRMQLGISAPCDHCTPTSAYSGAIVSFLPDGSDLRVDASGMRAPIGLAYYPGTNDLFVTMNQRDDLEDKTPGDWLAVVAPGQDWGFPDCYGQGGSACAGVPAPVAELDKHAAVSGVAIVTGQLGAGIGNAAVVAEWGASKLVLVSLTKTGATYTGTASLFVTGLKNPVAVALAPDGSLIAGDWTTGTIYRIASA
jgi:glucose/arabinose dehydrogenase